MTSRVEELQRMCDNINEHGGLDSEEWHTALLAQIAQNLAVIADVILADRKTENSSEIPNNCDEPQTQLTAKCLECNNSKACKENHWEGCIYEPLGYEVTAVIGTIKTEPQTERSE